MPRVRLPLGSSSEHATPSTTPSRLVRTPLTQAHSPSRVFPTPSSSLTLMRRDAFTPHPAGISSLIFALADIVIHNVFHTSHLNPTINLASS
ncbi:hypothetical protein B0H11DRAFT_2230451 [Mycena galericulata]|nr:hypothetical protein B0H11DRAFT_2230451 [Mycena galericulata]